MKILLLSLSFLMLVACVQPEKEKQEITYFSEMREIWLKGKLQDCQKESIKITLALYDARQKANLPAWTQRDVQRVEKFIFDSCLKHYNLAI